MSIGQLEKLKTNSKMLDLSQNRSVILLNVDGLNSAIKRERFFSIKACTGYTFVLNIRTHKI